MANSSIPCSYFESYDQYSPDEFSEITFNNNTIHHNYNVNGIGGSISGATLMPADHGYGVQHLPQLVMFGNNGGVIDSFPAGESEILSPRVPTVTFQEQYGESRDSRLGAVPTMLDYNVTGSGRLDIDVSDYKIQNYGGLQLSSDHSCEDCCGYPVNFSRASSATSMDNWGIQGNIGRNNVMGSMNIQKVGRYTLEERKNKILRYQKKRNQRNFNKTIKYACRKTLADRRVRIRGRFARNNESCDDESKKANSDNSPKENQTYSYDNDEIKNDVEEEEWLQEAVASFMYVPYSSEVSN